MKFSKLLKITYVLLNFLVLVTVKAAPHLCVNTTGLL